MKDDKWKKDSDTVFTAVSSAFDTIEEAKRAVVLMYVPDMSFSRAGISDALKRLENHFENKQ